MQIKLWRLLYRAFNFKPDPGNAGRKTRGREMHPAHARLAMCNFRTA